MCGCVGAEAQLAIDIAILDPCPTWKTTTATGIIAIIVVAHPQDDILLLYHQHITDVPTEFPIH